MGTWLMAVEVMSKSCTLGRSLTHPWMLPALTLWLCEFSQQQFLISLYSVTAGVDAVTWGQSMDLALEWQFPIPVLSCRPHRRTEHVGPRHRDQHCPLPVDSHVREEHPICR